MATSKCISVVTSSSADASIVQWDCAPRDTEYFQLTDVGNGGRGTTVTYYLFQNVHTGKCLNVEGASTKSGARIIQWACEDVNNEQITLL